MKPTICLICLQPLSDETRSDVVPSIHDQCGQEVVALDDALEALAIKQRPKKEAK